MELPVPILASKEGGSETCRAVFIRAPAIVDVGPSVQVLAEYPLAPGQSVNDSDQVKILNLCQSKIFMQSPDEVSGASPDLN